MAGSLVTVTRHGATAVMTYANPPFGTMTAAGSQEMLDLLPLPDFEVLEDGQEFSV